MSMQSSTTVMNRAARVAAWAVVLLSVGATIGFGAVLPGYLQSVHPVALLGAHGIAHAQAFNHAGFVLPGLLAAFVAWRLREARPADAPWALRIGAWLLLLSALAFAMQGVVRLDPRDLESPSSRLHALVWTVWWVAFAAGALLVAIGRWMEGERGLAPSSSVLAALLLVWLVLLGPTVMGAIAQRAAFAIWLLCWPAVARLRPHPGTVA